MRETNKDKIYKKKRKECTTGSTIILLLDERFIKFIQDIAMACKGLKKKR